MDTGGAGSSWMGSRVGSGELRGVEVHVSVPGAGSSSVRLTERGSERPDLVAFVDEHEVDMAYLDYRFVIVTAQCF